MLSIIILFFSCQRVEQQFSDEKKQAIAKEVKKLAAEIQNAFDFKKLDLFFPYFSDHTTLIRDGEIEESWTEHKKKAREMSNHLKTYDVVNEKMKIDVLSKDVAICYFNYNYTIIDNTDNKMEGIAAQTWLFNRENNKWLIRHVHMSELK